MTLRQTPAELERRNGVTEICKLFKFGSISPKTLQKFKLQVNICHIDNHIGRAVPTLS